MDRDRKSILFARYENGEESVYEEAVKLYEEALEGEPYNPILLFEYGVLQEYKGIRLLRKATECYEKGIDLNKDMPYYKNPSIMLKLKAQIIGARARLFENEKNVELYKKKIAENPMEVTNYHFLISAYLKADQVAEARKVAEAALKIFQKDAILNNLMGDILSRRGLMEEALVSWRRAIELDSNIIDPRFSMAFYFKKERRLEEAAIEWEEIIKFLHANGFNVEAEWPEKELEEIKRELEQQK